MAVLDDVGKHVLLHKLDETGQDDLLFPQNTIDDVIIDEDGNSLKEYLPLVGNGGENEPLGATQMAEASVPAEALQVILSATLPADAEPIVINEEEEETTE